MSIRVLVVDDSATIRHKVGEQLRSHDIEVEEARNGREALDHLAPGHGFDVVVSDLKMPGVDGFTLVNTIQNAAGLRGLPVVILTSSDEMEDHVANLEAGASAYLTKPWDEIVLLAHVKRLAKVNRDRMTLEQASRTDPLTQLSNRRHGAARLTEEIQRAHRHGRGLTVSIMDIDHFKKVNDTLGHAAGDAVLKIVSKRLAEVSRDSDVVVRWGGEEFLFVFPETSIVDGARIVERFRAHLAAKPIVLDLAKPVELPVTISGGVAELEENDTIETLVDRADSALYSAKDGGRNKLLMWQLGQLRPVQAAA